MQETVVLKGGLRVTLGGFLGPRPSPLSLLLELSFLSHRLCVSQAVCPIGRSSLLPALLVHPGARHIRPFPFKGFTANLYGGAARSKPSNDNAGGAEAGKGAMVLVFR